MRLYKALNLAEELDRSIIHLVTGTLIRPKDIPTTDLNGCPLDGWELYDSPLPFTFETTFLGCDEMVDNLGKSLGTVYSFTEKVISSTPIGSRVKVTIEPL